MADETTTTAQPPKSEFEQHVETTRANLLKNPASIPDKFRVGDDPSVWVDNLIKAYVNMESHSSKLATENAEFRKKYGVADQAAQVPSPQPTQTPAAPDVQGLGIPEPPAAPQGPDIWKVVETEVSQTGDLSQATRDAVLKTGIPQAVLDQALTGIKATRQASLNEAKQMVGGEQNLNALIQWASTNLPADERPVVDAALKSPAWKTTLMGLKARWEASSPTHGEPRPTPTGSPQAGPSGVLPFRDEAERRSAYADPRYRDPHNESFRREVALRHEATLRQQGYLS